MSNWQEEALAALAEGERFIAVQDDSVRVWQKALHELTGGQNERPLLLWDEDGLRSQTYSDDLPEDESLLSALDFVRSFSGSAAFLFDFTSIDLTSQLDGLKRRLTAIGDKLAVDESVVVVFVTSLALPPDLAKRTCWFGEDGVSATETSAADATERPRAGVGGLSKQFADVRSLASFATNEWCDRLNAMSVDEFQNLVESGVWQDSLGRVTELRDVLRQKFSQKEEILDALFASAIAQVPCVLMGPPGTAKGHMIRSLCEGLGLNSQVDKDTNDGAGRQYFEYQLTRFTTPEEIFGPIHVQQLLENQTYRRVTDGYLPKAQIAFLDEIFKASSAILNTLLSLLNERVFYNEGRPEAVPLTTIFAASNEPPQEESLSALFDRFPIRIHCPSVDNDHLEELMDRSWSDAFDRGFSQNRVAVPHLACANDLRLLHKVSRVTYGGRSAETTGLKVGSSFKIEFLRCFRDLRNEASISDRSLASLYSFARASALLEGKQSMGPDDLDVFRFVKWDPSGELDRFVRNFKRIYRG